jgi:sialidase-1
MIVVLVSGLNIFAQTDISYYQIRGGLLNSYIKFEREKTGRVAFLGGSITYNPGWRDSICVYLQNRFPETEFEFIAAGIPSMGTTPAAFRLERDILTKGKVDLLFEEAAVNDATNGRTEVEQVRAMEGIVRHCLGSNPSMDIVIMHFVDPDKIASYNKGIEPVVITNHNRVAEHYNLPTINLAREVTERINSQEFNWEDDFKDLHPSPFGQGIYATSIINFLTDAWSGIIEDNDQMKDKKLPEKIDKHCYDKGSLIDINAAKLSGNWKIDPLWNPEDGTGTRANYVDVPMLIGDVPGTALRLEFGGSAIGIAVAAGQDAGVVEYRIDKGEWQKQDLFTSWSSQLHLPWYYTLAGELSHGKHLLEIRLANMEDGSNIGKACRIRYFFVNKF